MNEQQDRSERRPRLNLTTSQVAASALAACCASIVASYLGVAGTVIGAAVGSVVATTGAAVYAQLFRHGGAKIRRTLLVNGRVPEDAADLGRPADAASGAEGATGTAGTARPEAGRTGRTGRFYSARAEGGRPGEASPAGSGAATTASFWLPASSSVDSSPVEQTRVAADIPTVIGRVTHSDRPTVLATGPGHADDAGEDEYGTTRPRRAGAVTAIRRYRKPIGVLASVVAVFCVSISVGFLLGGPVRSVGTTSAPPQSTTTHRQNPRETGGGRNFGPDPSTSSSPTGSATPGTTASPSAAGTPTSTPSASQSAGAGATGTGTAGGGGAGATGNPTRQPFGGAANAGSNAP